MSGPATGRRPAVSVVMPFAGDAAAARSALAVLAALRTSEHDERVLADNSGVAAGLELPPGVRVVAAAGERSPARARNAGAAGARGEWILFLDADCVAPPDLLERYFLDPVEADVGALAGEVAPAGGPGTRSLAERYGAARSFLSQRAHLAHPYLPRAAAANLLVRRSAFEQLGGFYEGLRAAEDTDFSWRLQQGGWRLELRGAAHVAHRYRSSVADLRGQWRGYAAGRAWLSRRYPGFAPEPAASRALKRARRKGPGRSRRGGVTGSGPAPGRRAPSARPSRRDRAAFFALDALLAGEELAGLTLSNRPPAEPAHPAPVEVVLVAERFPAREDPLVEFALSLHRARVEAVARPEQFAPTGAAIRIDYREDDGIAARTGALVQLVLRHPLRCVRDRVRRGIRGGGPALSALAPAARRLGRDPGARVHGIGGEPARLSAARLAALAGARHEHHLGRS